MADELLTRSEAARLLRVSPRTLDRWADAGRLHRRYLGGSTRLVRFLAAEVRELAQGEHGEQGTG